MNDKDIAGFFLTGWYVFDNFSAFQVEWRGKLYPTAEHAYQAAHFIDTNPELAEQVRQCTSPQKASDFANNNSKHDDPAWKEKRLFIMEEILAAKLEQHAYVQEKLFETGSMNIVEMNNNDDFWGWGSDKNGQNHLGKIWMKLRDQLEINSSDGLNFTHPDIS